MTTQTLTLPEFLLRAIAEDEADAREYSDDDSPGTWRRWGEDVCKAHRAIVEDLAGLVDYDRDKFIVSPQVEAVALRTLKRMASVYADRDGFDPRWTA